MPTYDYKCLECSLNFEAFQKMSDEPLSECPNCGGSVKRLIGAGLSPIFKGSGFYQTDYKNIPGKSESKSIDSATDNSSKSKPDDAAAKSKTDTKKAG